MLKDILLKILSISFCSLIKLMILNIPKKFNLFSVLIQSLESNYC